MRLSKILRIGFADFREIGPDSWSLLPNPGGLATLKETQAALHAMARESIEQTLAKSREGVNERRAETQVGKEDMVMLRNCVRHVALDPRYDGP